MQTLREFFASSSGLAPARQGLGLGWLISALTGVAILLGAKEAEAGECSERTYLECGWHSGCNVSSKGKKPIRCCTFQEYPDYKFQRYPDCSFDRISCACVA